MLHRVDMEINIHAHPLVSQKKMAVNGRWPYNSIQSKFHQMPS